MSDAHLGQVVDGRYRLDRVLGEGAAGSVYAATQLSVDRTVAVKLLHETNSEQFAAEAKAIAKLNHTNVITLHDFGFDTDMDVHFMVMEYVDGVPLSERMQEVMSTELILSVALDVAMALHHAHSNGVLHRDLKPENVMLTRADDRVDVAKVLDFGLAHLSKERSGVVAKSARPVDEPEAAAPAEVAEPAEAAEPAEPAEPAAEEAPKKVSVHDESTKEVDRAELDALRSPNFKLPPLESLKKKIEDEELDGPETAVIANLDVSSDSVFAPQDEE